MRCSPVRWPLTVAEARAIQEQLSARVRRSGSPRVSLVAGADLAYGGDGKAWAAVVVVRLPGCTVAEVATASGRPAFPYVPGYLSFREGPLLLEAFGRVRVRPDLCLFDGQGIAHPRGCGLAAHLGVLLDVPSVGCAKSRLVGEHREPGASRGDWSPLRLEGRTVGAVLRSREGVRPLFVSVGHRVSLAAAIRWVLACCRYRVPEPIRLAEQVVNRLKGA